MGNYVVETKKVEIPMLQPTGFTIEIRQDTDAESPRDWDNLGEMICYHNRYDLGDREPNGKNRTRDRYTQEELKDIIERPDVISLPLYLYDHSGITMSCGPFSCQWDSGQVGYIFITKEKAREEYGWKLITEARRKLLLGYLENEVKTYDTYLTGQVLEYIITEDETEEVIDSCGSIYDEPDEVMKNAMGELLAHVRMENVKQSTPLVQPPVEEEKGA